MRDHTESDWSWLKDAVTGPLIYESPNKTDIKSRPAPDHPLHILTRGQLPVDIWYKVYGNKHE